MSPGTGEPLPPANPKSNLEPTQMISALCLILMVVGSELVSPIAATKS